MKSSALFYAIAIAVLMPVFWLAPKPVEGSYCGELFELGPGITWVINCDSEALVALARTPAALFEPEQLRQSRPLFILTVSGIGYLLLSLASLLGLPLDPLMVFALGYVLLNALLLWGALVLFERLLLRWQVPLALIRFASLVLLVNDLTQAFFWTPHMQMLAIFTPIALLYAADKLRDAPDFWPQALGFSLLAGMGMLFYGNFVIALPLIWVMGGLYAGLPLKQRIAFLPAATLLFVLPTVSWISLLAWKGVAYYNHAVEAYRQLVWVLDGIEQGTLGALTVLHAQKFAKSLWQWDTTPFLLGFIVYLGSLIYQKKGIPLALQPSAWLWLITVGFFAVLGFYDARLSFTLVPIGLGVLVYGVTENWEKLRPPLSYGVAAGLGLLWLAAHWGFASGWY